MSTINTQEIAHFSTFAHQWWDEQGPFKILHQLNPTRLHFIKDCIEQYRDLPSIGMRNQFWSSNKEARGDARSVPSVHEHIETDGSCINRPKVFSHRALDIGCGGGLISEPLARQGFRVTAIDATPENITAAKEHAKMMGLDIDYRHTSAEDLVPTGSKFDVITALEIIEHVADVPLFLQSCRDLLAPGGLLILSTLNRTPLSFLGGIVAAEYILRWVPQGTHHWKQFIKPSEMVNQLADLNMALCDLKGLHYSPFKNQWKLSHKLDINYMGCFKVPHE